MTNVFEIIDASECMTNVFEIINIPWTIHSFGITDAHYMIGTSWATNIFAIINLASLSFLQSKKI